MSRLITEEERARLLANGRRYDSDEEFDPAPIVHLFTRRSAARWLITHIEPESEPPYVTLGGLCDLGMGFPELGTVYLEELERIEIPRVERDPGFVAKGTISEYAEAARRAQRVVLDLPEAARESS